MYRAPVEDIEFVLQELIGEEKLRTSGYGSEYTHELADSVLREAARFAEDVLEPLNRSGDREGAHWTEEGVRTAKGFKDAYRRFVEGGWPRLRGNLQYGGQPVPLPLSMAVMEIWASSNLAFKLCPLLTLGAAEALDRFGSAEQKDLFLTKLITGEWTGTMNLTEPQAGSDLSQLRTLAVRAGDHYRISGQKIFITWGDHDCTDNIIHLVLARVEGAPAGIKGISLFVVPKILVNPDGSLGRPNEVRCLSLEHKLGIHASPTCTMAYGDDMGAVGYLVGKPNRGLECMFVMMNTARLGVGLEGYAIAERAFQQAAEYARSRIQGKPPGVALVSAPIIHHPDVKRMLLTMKSSIEAMRALTAYTAYQLDVSECPGDEKARIAMKLRGDLLIPITKGWCTELGNEIASVGIQVHGGMGFIEETGAAQSLRDVRITSIYEGTTGIQANDLVSRKLGLDRGASMFALLADATTEIEAIASSDSAMERMKSSTLQAIALARKATEALLASYANAPERALAVAVPYLKLCGFVLGGWLMTKSGVRACSKRDGVNQQFYEGKLRTARFYAAQVLPNVHALAEIVTHGSESVIETSAELI